jgi:hypothetical protein
MVGGRKAVNRRAAYTSQCQATAKDAPKGALGEEGYSRWDVPREGREGSKGEGSQARLNMKRSTCTLQNN